MSLLLLLVLAAHVFSLARANWDVVLAKILASAGVNKNCEVPYDYHSNSGYVCLPEAKFGQFRARTRSEMGCARLRMTGTGAPAKLPDGCGGTMGSWQLMKHPGRRWSVEKNTISLNKLLPTCSMYGILQYIYLQNWAILGVHVGKYWLHTWSIWVIELVKDP